MGINLRASRCGYCLRIAVVNEVPAAGWSPATATPLSTVDCPRLVRRRTTKCQHRPTVRRVIRPAPCPLSLTVNDSQSRVGGSGSTSRESLHRAQGVFRADYHDPVHPRLAALMNHSLRPPTRNVARACQCRLKMGPSVPRQHRPSFRPAASDRAQTSTCADRDESHLRSRSTSTQRRLSGARYLRSA